MKPVRRTLGRAVVVSVAWLVIFSFRNSVRKVHGWISEVTRSLLHQPALSPRQVLEPLPQPLARILITMYDREPQMGSDGVKHCLTPDTGVFPKDGMYIYNLCRKLKPRRTLEVGFAEGFSTLFFLAAVTTNGVGSHVAVDPFEISDWHGLGLRKVQESGMQSQFHFVQASSTAALPALIAEGSKFEIIFVDGDHRFDGGFADFVLSDALVTKGGYLLFHDLWMPSMQKLIAFIERNRPDYARRTTDANIAAFQKVGDDRRDWRHFVDF